MKALAFVLAAAGTILLLQGLWLPAKAALAQQLLARSWERTLADGARHPPWPWADHAPVARLGLPGDRRFVVLDGDAGNVLAFAPGHNPASGLPGMGETIVISGHRDTHFRALGDLHDGSELTLEVPGASARYRITGSRVVDARHWRQPIRQDERLLLVTCWPLDARTEGPQRLIVAAERVGGPRSPAAADSADRGP